jgi:hypothetical protein
MLKLLRVGELTRRTVTAQVARRIGGSLLGLLFLVAATGVQAGELRGDANCDGHVDQSDVAAVLAALFGGGDSCAGVDVNADGETSAADVIALMQILAESPTPATATATVPTGAASPTRTDTPKPPTVQPR